MYMRHDAGILAIHLNLGVLKLCLEKEQPPIPPSAFWPTVEEVALLITCLRVPAFSVGPSEIVATARIDWYIFSNIGT